MDAYVQLRRLGQGAFGTAILVHAKEDEDQLSVIKVVDLSKLRKREEEFALEEVRLLASFDHPNIVKYSTSFVVLSKLHIVMDYADCGDLRSLLKEYKSQARTMSEEQVLGYFHQLCLAIQYVHKRKVLHRDLKPENIFLTDHRRVLRVGDFGLARALEHSCDMATSHVGTPYYMSPEILNDTPYNAKTDVWSMGCVLYEICALRPPFEGHYPMDIARKVLRGKYEPLSAFYTTGLCELATSCLALRPSKRPSASILLAGVDRLLVGVKGLAGRPLPPSSMLVATNGQAAPTEGCGAAAPWPTMSPKAP